MGKNRALVFDVIIAGWGLVVSPSRLKWKIALHILANTSAVSRVQPTHKHLLISPPPYPCLSGCARPLGRGTPVSSPNPLVWVLFQLSLLWCWWCWVLGVVCCFIPQSSRLSSEVRAVNGLVSGCLVGRVLLLVLCCSLCQTHCLVLSCIQGWDVFVQ